MSKVLMSNRWSTNVLLFVAALLVAVAALAWGPIHSVLTIDRAEIDLSAARRQLPATSSITSHHGASSSPASPITIDSVDPTLPPAPVAGQGEPTPNSSPTTAQPSAGSTTTASSSSQPEPVSARALDDDLVVLLVGSDARPPYEGARADVIILAHASPDPTEPVTLVSIPRDVTLDIPCLGRQRVNAALNGCPERQVSGLELLAVTVEDFAGLTIDHVAAVGFDGFESVVDELGGYRVCVDHPIRDIDALLRLEAGCQTLDGETALAWVRSRSPEVLIDGSWQRVPSSDLDRTDTQRDFLTDLAERARQRRDAGGIGRLIEAVAQTVTIDDDWSMRSMVGSALALRDRAIVGGRIDARPYTDSRGRAVLEAYESYEAARSRLLAAD